MLDNKEDTMDEEKSLWQYIVQYAPAAEQSEVRKKRAEKGKKKNSHDTQQSLIAGFNSSTASNAIEMNGVGSGWLWLPLVCGIRRHFSETFLFTPFLSFPPQLMQQIKRIVGNAAVDQAEMLHMEVKMLLDIWYV